MTNGGKSKSNGKPKKIFVLDTSVILYDHNAFENFEEHDVALPIQVLEELDNIKTGNETKNFEARSFIRLMDNLSRRDLLNQWIPLKKKATGKFKVVMDKNFGKTDAGAVFGSDKIDHRILNCALALKEEYTDKKVILV
jgi:PhoH-like ATPase